jgi:demethylmenaquinone methyltransferase/2-methoxy-6-polyprenyl-1,4-benzoquinol methylase
MWDDAMDAELRRGMFQYYDERAPEYEEAYVRGTGTASIPDPQVFRAEAETLTRIVERFARGRLIDLACGTGYWLPYYAKHCSTITLIDQSAKMLDECREKVGSLGLGDRASIIQADVLDHTYEPRAYDAALVGFFLSHFSEDREEQRVFDILEATLDSSGQFLILDSAWSPERARFNAKSERQARHLNDGTRFEIFKRYYDRQDITDWARKYGVGLDVVHFGTAFLAVVGGFGR